MNNKILIFCFLLIVSVTMVSAVTIHSGESYELNLSKPYEYYSIAGNSTEVILNITQEGNIVTITPNKYSLSDNYEIIFFDSEKEIVTIYSGGGGGGGSNTIYKDRNITKYVDKEIIKYEDKEVEVPGETVEVITNDVPLWGYLIILILLIAVVYLIFRKKETVERGYDEYE